MTTTEIDRLLNTRPPTAAEWERVLVEAHRAAVVAIMAKGPENMNALDCGFAWVVLRPATHPLVAHCKRRIKALGAAATYSVGRKYGRRHWNGGWEWWGPGEFHGQAIGHLIAGAQAFRDVLARHNISAEVGSRYD